MISVLFDFFFVFNMQIEDAVADEIKRQLDTLQNLYITDFEVIMVKSSPGTRKMKLYEDPVIELLHPDGIDDKVFRAAMFSVGIMQNVNIDYDMNRSCFTIDKNIDEVKAMFTGFETLLFLEMPCL